MSIPLDVLEAEALSLPKAERARLLGRLLVSLAQDAEWEEAWAEEADRREALIQSGQSAWVNGPQAVASLCATFK